MISSTLVGAAADEASVVGLCGAGASLATGAPNADDACNAMMSAALDAKRRSWLLDCMIPPSRSSYYGSIDNDCSSPALDFLRPILRCALSSLEGRMIEDRQPVKVN